LKYAFMTFSCPKLPLADVLELATQLGYDGIEPRITAGHAHGIEPELDPAARKAVRDQAARAGIALCCIATSARYADPATAEQNVADTRRFIDLASDLACPRLRVFGGGLGANLSRADAIELVATSLRSLAEHAARRDVTLCLETHDDWCDPRHVASIMKRVDHPAIAVNWDVMHPVRQNLATIDESFDILRPWIRHLHVHDGKPGDKGFIDAPMGAGQIDHRRVIQRLLEINYDGYISGEWIRWGQTAEEHLPRELKALRQYEAESSQPQA
jgi:sugar phosphate isomerase/epimerase